jgi:hypothetical protein
MRNNNKILLSASQACFNQRGQIRSARSCCFNVVEVEWSQDFSSLFVGIANDDSRCALEIFRRFDVVAAWDDVTNGAKQKLRVFFRGYSEWWKSHPHCSSHVHELRLLLDWISIGKFVNKKGFYTIIVELRAACGALWIMSNSVWLRSQLSVHAVSAWSSCAPTYISRTTASTPRRELVEIIIDWMI